MRIILFSLLIMATVVSADSGNDSPVIAFLDGSVIPMQGEHILRNHTVLVANGRIIEVGPADQVKVPSSAIAINARGKYLIPGLIDTHAHVNVQNDLLLYLAFGVTTIQGLGGNPLHSKEWTDQLAQGKLLGPNYVNCDSIADGLSTAEQVRSFVTEVADRGLTCIKIYSPPDWTVAAYQTLLQEAKAKGIRTAGHLPRNLDIQIALNSGLQSVAHAEEYLYTYFNKLENQRNPDNIPYVVRLTKENGVSVIPNLTAYHRIGLQSGDQVQELLNDDALRYMPRTVRENWSPPFNRYRKKFNAEDAKRLLVNYTFLQKMTLQMQQSGVTLALGTDSSRNMPFVVPGISALLELEELVASGLTAFQALLAGTSGGAKTLALSGEIGQIRAGMRADLILLNADPLLNIGNIRKQAGVMVRGRWLPKEEIGKFLDAHVDWISRYDTFIQTVLDAGIEGSLDKAKQLYAISNLQLGEPTLNELGYEFLNVREDFTGGISLFRMNAELFPESWNAYDSLAEGYMNARKNDLAIKFYMKSLELNKDNSNAESMLEKLRLQN